MTHPADVALRDAHTASRDLTDYLHTVRSCAANVVRGRRPAPRPGRPPHRGGGRVTRHHTRGDDTWRDRAACANHPNPEAFFPVDRRGWNAIGQEQLAAPAKAVCGACPVTGECLQYALTTSAVGVWGGTTDEERAAAARRTTRQRLKEA